METTANPNAANTAQEVKNFYAKSLPPLLKTILLRPISGVQEVVRNANAESMRPAIMLMASTAVLYTALPYATAGDLRAFIGFGPFAKLGLALALFLLGIAGFTFGIKSMSGKGVLQRDLLTGALCGIPAAIALLAVVLLSMGNENPASAAMQGMQQAQRSMEQLQNMTGMQGLPGMPGMEQMMENARQSAGAAMGGTVGIAMLFAGMGRWGIVICALCALMMVNLVQQSLTSAGVKEAMAWYGSVVVVLLAGALANTLIS